MKGEWRSPAELARQACEIEIERLGRPIGKQDQYIAAFGGLQDIHFLEDGSVTVHPVICRAVTRDRLVRSLLLFYTGMQREAGSVLSEARQRLESSTDARAAVDGLVALAANVRLALFAGRVERIGALLAENWRLKKQMASNVSNGFLDDVYDAALRAGADGGKISGAGAGGCLLLFARRRHRASVRAAMAREGLRALPFDCEPEGSRIIHFSH
jgi:D-glycero-alpha-D-manno-heptose-7-phosphate kinase